MRVNIGAGTGIALSAGVLQAHGHALAGGAQHLRNGFEARFRQVVVVTQATAASASRAAVVR